MEPEVDGNAPISVAGQFLWVWSRSTTYEVTVMEPEVDGNAPISVAWPASSVSC